MGISLRPQHLKRYKDIAVLLIKYGNEDIVKVTGLDEALDTESRKVDPCKLEQLPKDLENLGPAYVKLGQFLSSRGDMMPPEYIEALERLQENVKPFAFEDAEQIVQKELGVRISKAFMSFEKEPVGSASLGQVHRATLRDGRDVVVKIQRPNIKEEIIEDLDVFNEIAEFLQAHTEAGKKYLLDELMSEFRKFVLRELNYKNEQQNLKILAENLREFEQIIVPEPIEDYTTSAIITMDFIKGTKVTSITPLRKMDIDGKRLADTLFHSYMKQIVIDGFYHADPHPGNIFITGDNRIAILDLGMVGYLSDSLQQNLLYILLAIGDGRGDDVAKYALKIGRETETFNKEVFESKINELISKYSAMSIKNVQVGKVILELTKISSTNGVYVPAELTMLGKTLLNLDKIGKTLDPDFEPNEAINRYSNKLLQQKLLKSANSSKSYEVLLESKEFLEKLPSRVNSILDKVSNNELEVKVNAVDEAYLMNGFQKVANRITAGIIFGSLIIGAAMLMRFETSFKLFGYSGIAIIFFIIAALGGLFVAFRSLLKDEPDIKKIH
jgi:predicted unusual protein kinase regulating ubiquinone biosynthesis (AarF/ABC1/UbiB family)